MYDLTYSSTFYGEYTTSVNGTGKNPGEKEIMNVGLKAGMQKKFNSNVYYSNPDYIKWSYIEGTLLA